ncbi:hypothetical protein, variant 2 [Sphaeroforma arctica JP610]|uniref:Uncharacterized protein n=1 Tax=Sphaeroforma arctica JP610 TaxID=667725 RepID=A0A0L0FZP1_9EUKA|nr:hypothetical protein, variant 2 [Sphaeroforma arctica JP610]KNC81438.1 hypothetical protein, variant 2 [Sphaeroforma arctica JP610]|eukprot:XP_014155340.1 hypothetical protein, variant 2 [Sphaeroforma arctica JP610]
MNERQRPRDSNEIRRNLAPTFAAASGAPSAATSGNMGEANPISGRNASAHRQGITNAGNTRTHSTSLNATAYAYVQHAKDVAMGMREKQQKQTEMNRHDVGVSATQSSALVGAGTGVGAQLAPGLQQAAMQSAELVPTATGKQQHDTLRTAVRPPTLGTMSHQLRPQVIQQSQQALSHQPQAQVQAQTQSHAPGHIQTHALYTKTKTFEKPQQSFGALLEGMKKLKQTHVESECKIAQQNETIGEYEVKMKEQNSRLQELQKRCGHLERKLQVELKSRDEVLRKIQSINTLCLSLKEKMSNIDEVIAKGEEDKDDIKRELKRVRVGIEHVNVSCA